jgi:hypothetical protein
MRGDEVKVISRGNRFIFKSGCVGIVCLYYSGALGRAEMGPM